MNWDPDQYLKFEEQRMRPGYDLLARIPMQSYSVIYDLGCGTGHLTRLLQRYWPDAEVFGIDSSKEMLQVAQSKPSSIIWKQEDIRHFKPQKPADLIFSNATLQWLSDHNSLLPQLIDYLNPNGVLAIQMPNNYHQPSHRQVLISARSGLWRKKLEPLLPTNTVLTPETYYQILARLTNFQDIWQTVYYSILSGENPVVEWVKGTYLRSLLNALEEPERSEFLADYIDKIAKHYIPNEKGLTLFPFQRLFIVAQK